MHFYTFFLIVLIFRSVMNFSIRKCSESDDLSFLIPDIYFNTENSPILDQKFEINENTNDSLQCDAFNERALLPHDISFASENEISIIEYSADSHTSNNSRIILEASQFCIGQRRQGDSKDEFYIQYCIPKCGEGKHSCLRKCCSPTTVLDLESFTCVETEKKWIARIDPESKDEEILKNIEVTHFGEPQCKLGNYEVEFTNNSEFKRLALLPNTFLLLETSDEKYEIPWNEFCIDGIATTSNDSDGKSYFENRVAVVCIPEEELKNETNNQLLVDVLEKYRATLYPTLTTISTIFLLMTTLIYSLLWKDLNLPGWLQFCYSASLLATFALLTSVRFWSQEIIDFSTKLCEVIGYTLHGSFLSCFFWLTSMNIDLWLSFRHSKMTTTFYSGRRNGSGNKRGKKRFFGFAFLSITIPILITITSAITDSKFKNGEKINPLLYTGIGEHSCALNIQDRVVQFIYFYSPVGVLLFINLTFFFCTVLCLRERQRETKFAHRQICNVNNSKESADLLRFKLFTRLFFIMGILWIFELVSWLTVALEMGPGIQGLFLFTDCLNALQGIPVFVLFVWKPQTLKQLKKKLRKWKIQGHFSSSLTSSWKTSNANATLKSTGNSSVKSGSTKSCSINGSICNKTAVIG